VIEQQAQIGTRSTSLRATSPWAALVSCTSRLGNARPALRAFDHRLVGHGLILGQAQAGFLAAHHRQRPAIEALALAQHFPRLFQQHRAGFGQARLAAAAALEQADAQVRFQQGDRVADRRLRLALLRATAENERCSATLTNRRSCSRFHCILMAKPISITDR
jgi:hypothetical protein